jgi:hypothetical protein
LRSPTFFQRFLAEYAVSHHAKGQPGNDASAGLPRDVADVANDGRWIVPLKVVTVEISRSEA